MREQDTISVQEMAQRLGVTTQTIYNYIDRELIPSTRVRRGLRYRLVVRRADFESAAERLTGDIAGLDKDGAGDVKSDGIRTTMSAASVTG